MVTVSFDKEEGGLFLLRAACPENKDRKSFSV